MNRFKLTLLTNLVILMAAVMCFDRLREIKRRKEGIEMILKDRTEIQNIWEEDSEVKPRRLYS